MDSCAHYGVAQENLKWTFVATPQIVSNGGPRGGQCLSFKSPVALTRSHQSHFIWGWRYQTTASQQNSQGRIYSFSHAGETELGGLRVESDGTLSIYAGNNSFLIQNTGSKNSPGNPTGLTTFKLIVGTWYWFEMEVILMGSGSSPCEVQINFRINEQLSLTGTASSGVAVNSLLLQSATADFHEFQGAAGDFPSNGCDFIFIRCDGTGLINAFPGDCAIDAIYPDSDQTINWMTTGTPQYSQINEHPPNGDLTYIYTNNAIATPIDSFLFQPVAPFNGTIIAVHLLAYARKDNGGGRTFSLTVSDKVQTGTPTFYGTDSYIYFPWCYDADPDTSSAWTVTGFNAKKFGVQLLS